MSDAVQNEHEVLAVHNGHEALLNGLLNLQEMGFNNLEHAFTELGQSETLKEIFPFASAMELAQYMGTLFNHEVKHVPLDKLIKALCETPTVVQALDFKGLGIFASLANGKGKGKSQQIG